MLGNVWHLAPPNWCAWWHKFWGWKIIWSSSEKYMSKWHKTSSNAQKFDDSKTNLGWKNSRDFFFCKFYELKSCSKLLELPRNHVWGGESRYGWTDRWMDRQMNISEWHYRQKIPSTFEKTCPTIHWTTGSQVQVSQSQTSYFPVCSSNPSSASEALWSFAFSDLWPRRKRRPHTKKTRWLLLG